MIHVTAVNNAPVISNFSCVVSYTDLVDFEDGMLTVNRIFPSQATLRNTSPFNSVRLPTCRSVHSAEFGL